MQILIRHGRVLDPAQALDQVTDLFIVNGKIAALGAAPPHFAATHVIDASGQVVCPGLIDLCARVREPGQEHKATLASELRAAVASGITSIVCPPDTEPPIDEPAVVEWMRRRAATLDQARLWTLGALTHGLRGERLAELAALQEAGCVGVSDGGQPITNSRVLRRALEYAATFELTVFLTPLDPALSHGCAHQGHVATRMGLAGIPEAAETAALAQQLELVRDLGVRVHFGRLSSARSVELIARAKADGLPVSADVAVHHLHLTEMDLAGFDSHCHVRPPLRSGADKAGLVAGVVSGVVDVICSDHQPHEPDAKLRPFGDTAPGISGLDTLLALSLHLHRAGKLSLSAVLERVTAAPARILGLDLGHLRIGAAADLCIFELDSERLLEASALHSKGKNTPLLGWSLPGRVTHTLRDGQVVYQAD